MDRLDPRTSLLLVVDLQERLAAAIPQATIDHLIANVVILLEAARLLGVAVVASEQYPTGLGPTLGSLADRLRALGVEPIDKLTFDACAEPRIARAIADRAPRAVVLVGVETHVCVFQTARELSRRGIDVRVAADAVASRRKENWALGLTMCERAGAIAMPTEAVAFDWLGRAGTDEFRTISKLVR
jgi:nicotinamidase-related amidase